MSRIQYQLFLITVLLPISTFAQWKDLGLPTTSMNRFDDVFFLEPGQGWAVGRETGNIFHTQSGDTAWTMQFQDTTKYFRSIEFANDQLGFCGSLDSALFRTTNGGVDWHDITDSIQPTPAGICGLAVPSDSVVFGCGKWTGPAFVIKSTDGGDHWTYTDLSSLATTLVDIYFFNEQEGFASGMANPSSAGGIILHTVDGGDNWNVHYTTGFPEDVIWKIQCPDPLHLFGSIEGQPASDNIRYVHSRNGGQHWNLDTVQTGYHYIQSIGFLDSLHGWVGGLLLLMETHDGGITWDTSSFSGFNFNRFFRLNDSIAYLSGNNIYRYDREAIPTGYVEKDPAPIHNLKVYPNPTAQELTIDINYHHETFSQLKLFGENGMLLQTVFDGKVTQGKQKFMLNISTLKSPVIFVILKTNDAMLFEKVVKR